MVRNIIGLFETLFPPLKNPGHATGHSALILGKNTNLLYILDQWFRTGGP